MLDYVFYVSFLLCVTFSTCTEGQQLGASGDCGSLQNGYNLYYQCVLQCYKHAFSFNAISGDLCTARASINGLQKKNFTIQDVAISLKCITGYCQATVPQPVCIGTSPSQIQTPSSVPEMTTMNAGKSDDDNDDDCEDNDDDCEDNDDGNSTDLRSEQSSNDGVSSNIITESPFPGTSYVTFSPGDAPATLSVSETSTTVSSYAESVLFTPAPTESSTASETEGPSTDTNNISKYILTTFLPILDTESDTSTTSPFTTTIAVEDSIDCNEEGNFDSGIANSDENNSPDRDSNISPSTSDISASAISAILSNESNSNNTATNGQTNVMDSNNSEGDNCDDDSTTTATAMTNNKNDADGTTDSSYVTATKYDVNNSNENGYDNGQINENDQGPTPQFLNAQNTNNNPVPVNPTNQWANIQQYTNARNGAGTQFLNAQQVNSQQPNLNQRTISGSNSRNNLQLTPTNFENQGNGRQNTFGYKYTNFGNNGQFGSSRSNPGYVVSNNWNNRGSFSGINTGGSDVSNGWANGGLPSSGNAYAVQSQNTNQNLPYGMNNGGMASGNNRM